MLVYGKHCCLNCRLNQCFFIDCCLIAGCWNCRFNQCFFIDCCLHCNAVGLKVQQPEQRKFTSCAETLLWRETDANCFLLCSQFLKACPTMARKCFMAPPAPYRRVIKWLFYSYTKNFECLEISLYCMQFILLYVCNVCFLV